MWRQILESKLNRDPSGRGVDEYHILTSGSKAGDYDVMSAAFREHSIREHSSRQLPELHYMANNGGNLQLGTVAHIGTVLGPEHEFAHELSFTYNELKQGRPIKFCHAYSAPTGAVEIPAFESFVSDTKERLLSLLEQAHAANPPPGPKDPLIDKKSILIDAPNVNFSQKQASSLSTGWDKVAAEMKAGKHVGKMAVFDKDGTFVSMSALLEPTAKQNATDAGLNTARTMERNIPLFKNVAFQRGAIIAGIALTGFLGWRLIEKQRRREAEQKTAAKLV